MDWIYTHWIFCGSAGTACKWVRKTTPINEQSETEFKWLKLHFMQCHYMPVVIGKDKTCFRSAHCVFACLLIQQNSVSRGKMNKPNPNPNCLSVTIRLKLLRFECHVNNWDYSHGKSCTDFILCQIHIELYKIDGNVFQYFNDQYIILTTFLKNYLAGLL